MTINLYRFAFLKLSFLIYYFKYKHVSRDLASFKNNGNGDICYNCMVIEIKNKSLDLENRTQIET